MEEKLSTIESILEELKEEKKRFAEEEKKRIDKINKEWRKKVELKYKKENEKLEKLEKQKQLSQHWGMLRWVTEYIQEHQEDWELEKMEKEREAREELENWNKSRRLEKIAKLKEKWKSNNVPISPDTPINTTIPLPEIPTPPKPTTPTDKWLVWRKKDLLTPQQVNLGFDVKDNNPEVESNIQYKEVVIKQPKLIQTTSKPEKNLSPHEEEQAGRSPPKLSKPNMDKNQILEDLPTSRSPSKSIHQMDRQEQELPSEQNPKDLDHGRSPQDEAEFQFQFQF